MRYDYFLVNRAIQIQRLLEGTSGKEITIPDRHLRAGCSRPLANLYRSIDRIRKLPVGDKQTKGLFAKLSISSLLSLKKSDSQKPLLTRSQRELLLDFERNVVRVRLEDDPQSAQAGTLIFNAIIGDYEYFNGLKPLPQYSDDFAYELLFPSWLNLNTVMIQPTTSGDDRRFNIEQQRATLQFLEDWTPKGQPDDSELVAIMTIIANRFEPPRSHQLMQHLIDLSFDRDGNAVSNHVERLTEWQSMTDSAETLANWIEDYAIVYSCLQATSHQKRYDVAKTKIVREELPRAIRETLPEIQDDDGQRDAYLSVLGSVRTIVDTTTTGGFETEMEQLLNDHSSQLVELLGMVVVSKGDSRARPQPIQRLVAELASRQTRDDGQIDIERLNPFAHNVAPRMDGLSRSTTIFFEAEFIRKEQNRTAFLGGCRSSRARTQLSGQLIKLATSTKKADRFLHLVAIAAVLDPSIEMARLGGIHSSIAVLQINQMEQSIGRNELSDLIGDIRATLPDSLNALAKPLEAALGKSDRLAKLYLTLNEEVQILQHSGNISNFGVTRASFSHLTRLADDDG